MLSVIVNSPKSSGDSAASLFVTAVCPARSCHFQASSWCGFYGNQALASKSFGPVPTVCKDLFTDQVAESMPDLSYAGFLFKKMGLPNEKQTLS
jgi:hypothetical protein